MPQENYKLKKAISKELAELVFTKSQENINDMGITDTGELFLSGDVRVHRDFSEVIYDAPHASPVNFGSQPHAIHSEMLIDWVRRKLNKTGKEGQRVAFLIAQKIKHQGTQPKPFLDNAIEFVKNSNKKINIG